MRGMQYRQKALSSCDWGSKTDSGSQRCLCLLRVGASGYSLCSPCRCLLNGRLCSRIKVSSGEPQHGFSLECAQRKKLHWIFCEKERMNVHAPKKFCGIDWTDALRDVLRSLSNALWSLQLCIDLVCIWMCSDLYLSCHPWFARCERVGIYASGIVFCNEFFVLRHYRGIPGHWLWWPIVLFLAHVSFSFVSCIALTSFNLERHGF